MKKKIVKKKKTGVSSPAKPTVVAKKTTVAVGFVLDGSGSMGPVQQVTIDGCNQFLNKLKTETEVNYLFSLSIFRTTGAQAVIDQPYALTALQHVAGFSKDNYKPDGGTPLYDAIGHAVRRLQSAQADKFLVVIMTDGEENSSQEWNLSQIHDLIKDKEALGNWTFLFLSSDLSAKAVGVSLGIHIGNVGHYEHHTVGLVAAAMGRSVNSYSASHQTMSNNFMKEHQVEGVSQDWASIAAGKVSPMSVTDAGALDDQLGVDVGEVKNTTGA